jgi:DNA-binding MarR family transcriptional regulator
MSKKPSATTISAWAKLVRTQTLLVDQINTSLSAAGLPGLAWYDVLLELHRVQPKGLRQYEIGEKTLLTKHNLSRLIDKLEDEQLLERRNCDEDSRGKVVFITAEGKKRLKQMWPIYAEHLSTFFESKLTLADITQLEKILAKL